MKNSPFPFSLACATLALLTLAILNSANAYYSFVRAGQRTTWIASTFTTDLSGSPFQGVDLMDLDMAATSPNDDTFGLLVVADGEADGNNCSDGTVPDVFGPPGPADFLAVYDAMAEWDGLTTTAVNFAFMCALGDIGTAHFDNITDTGSLDLEIWRSGNPVFNGTNEVVFDDTPTAELITALGIGIDPNVLLGLAFPFDSSQDLITNSDANGDIEEGFLILNISGMSPSGIDLQGVVTHELGHLLGLAHPATFINVADGDDSLVPTMHFSALDDSLQTRTLEADDIAGITVSYPGPGEPLTSFGAISGQALSSSGTALSGAAIIAQNDATGAEVGIILGGNPDLVGATSYIIDGVPAGTYTVRLAAADGGAAAGGVNTSGTGNIDSIFSTPPFSFSPVFFEDQTNISDATSVAVTTGVETASIDFFTSISGGDSSGLFGIVLPDPESCQAIRVAGPATGASFLFFLLPLLTLLHAKWKARLYGKRPEGKNRH